MMMSYNSLVSSLQAKSVLSNIHASLVQHDGWLTKEHHDRYHLVLENQDEDSGLLAIDGMKDMLFFQLKESDAKDYMIISYGLYYIKDEKFHEEFQTVLPNLIFGELIDINWESVTPKDLLNYWSNGSSSDDNTGFSVLNKKLGEYKSDNAYSPFSISILKGQTLQFITNLHVYIIQSVLSYLKYGKNNIILGNVEEEWNCVEKRKFDTIYLDCSSRQETLLLDLDNALAHLTDKGVILMKTKNYGNYDFRKYIIDNTLLEAFFSEIMLFDNFFILRKNAVLPKVYMEIPHLLEEKDTYTGNNTLAEYYSFDSIKAVDYEFYELRYMDISLNKGDMLLKPYNILTPYKFVEHKDSTGHLFCYKNFAKDFNTFYLQSQSLDVDDVRKYRKAISPVLIISKEKGNPQMAYIDATNEIPAYIPHAYLAYSIKEKAILPEYIYYLTQNGKWQEKVTGNCIDFSANIPYLDYEGNHLITETDEQYMLNWCHNYLSIPSVKIQRDEIEDARLLQKVMDDKTRAKEALFNQKEWLNEAHIRNTKHRLTNDLFPLATGLDLLKNYLKKSGGHIQKDDMISKVTGLTVGTLIENLLDSVKIVENTVSDFTNMKKYTDKCKICISEFLKSYCENLSQKYTTPFNIEMRGLDICAKIEISRLALTDMLDNIVGNAVRHGFVKDNDNIIFFEIEITNNGMCRLSIANNGVPMSERAKSIYYERGAFAGSTGHSGIGGAIVKDVCDQFKGKTYISEKEGFPVVIVTEFPVLNL